MAEGVRKSFKKILQSCIYEWFIFQDVVSEEMAAKLKDAIKSCYDQSEEIRYTEILSGKEKSAAIYIDRLTDLMRDIDANFTIINTITPYDSEKVYKITCAKVEEETKQAMEAVVHNLNTLHSRSGGQVPFSSLNFGTDISPEGRLVMFKLLDATEAGLGNGETAIFPISIFKLKAGVSYNPGDPNYDLFQRSCVVSAKRLFPNFVNIDAPYNLQYYKPGDYNTEIATMGQLPAAHVKLS